MPTRALKPALVAAVGAGWLLAGAAVAQQAPTPAGRTEGQRYLSWAGYAGGATPANVVAAQARAANGMIPRRVAPSQAASRPQMQAPHSVQQVSRGLTPASAWLNPQPVTSFAPGSPDPLGYTRELPAPVSQPLPERTPAYLPDQGAPVRPSPAPQRPMASQFTATQPNPEPEVRVQSPPTPTFAEQAPPTAPTVAQTTAAAPVDPMAPRPDAPIFRMGRQTQTTPQGSTGQAAPQVYAQAGTPSQPGARYYSVHRDAGHAPDPTPLPEAVYFDSVALDLAEPPQDEPPRRDAQGRRIAPARDEDPERP